MLALALTMGSFLWIFGDHLRKYLSHPTESTYSYVQRDELGFPAISICSEYYKYEQFKTDSKVGLKNSNAKCVTEPVEEQTLKTENLADSQQFTQIIAS